MTREQHEREIATAEKRAAYFARRAEMTRNTAAELERWSAECRDRAAALRSDHERKWPDQRFLPL